MLPNDRAIHVALPRSQVNAVAGKLKTLPDGWRVKAEKLEKRVAKLEADNAALQKEAQRAKVQAPEPTAFN